MGSIIGNDFFNGKIPGEIPTEVFVAIATIVTKQSGKIIWRDFLLKFGRLALAFIITRNYREKYIRQSSVKLGVWSPKRAARWGHRKKYFLLEEALKKLLKTSPGWRSSE